MSLFSEKTPEDNFLLEYAAVNRHNRDYFLLSFADDYHVVTDLILKYQHLFEPLGVERDYQGKSQAALLFFQNIALRALIFGFDAVQACQISLAWPSMRTAIETILIIGKLVRNPALGTVWSDWDKDKASKRRYIETFQTNLIKENALPRCEAFRGLLSRINDQYLHPNPGMIFSEENMQRQNRDQKMGTIVTFFGGADQEIIAAHTFSYVRVFADLFDALHELVVPVMTGKQASSKLRSVYQERRKADVQQLISRSAKARKILATLGNWDLSTFA